VEVAKGIDETDVKNFSIKMGVTGVELDHKDTFLDSQERYTESSSIQGT
jgi:hypothetical protein